MVAYDFDEKDIKEIIWEMSNRIKALEDELRDAHDLKDAVIALQKIVILLEWYGLIEPEFKDENN